MVKNVSGGNKSKKLARKNFNDGLVRQKTRLVDPDETCEMYASVIKMCGNGIVEVICNDGILRNCVIRNKFRGRNKRNNLITLNSKILVGLRDWEILSSDKKPKCDLLQVYKDYQYKDVMNDTNCNWSVLITNEGDIDTSDIGTNDKVFEFVKQDQTDTVDFDKI